MTAERELRRSLAIARRGGFEEHVARAYCNLVGTYVDLREPRRALETAREALDYCADRDLDAWARYVGAWKGVAEV